MSNEVVQRVMHIQICIYTQVHTPQQPLRSGVNTYSDISPFMSFPDLYYSPRLPCSFFFETTLLLLLDLGETKIIKHMLWYLNLFALCNVHTFRGMVPRSGVLSHET